MKRFLHPLLLVVARATDRELGRYVEYLKTENRILRSKLPKRIIITTAERERLLNVGRHVGYTAQQKRATVPALKLATQRTAGRDVVGGVWWWLALMELSLLRLARRSNHELVGTVA